MQKQSQAWTKKQFFYKVILTFWKFKLPEVNEKNG